MSKLSQQVSELSADEKRALVAELLHNRAHKRKRYPLSFAQERLWFIDQLIPDNPAYNISRAIHCSGSLDVAILRQTINEIVRRHEALRTIFEVVDGQPMQIVLPALTLPLPVVDLRALPAQERAATVQRLSVDEAQRPFDLATGPLLRGTLLQLADDEHVILLTTHHIVFDGSMEVFLREFTALYTAFMHGQPSPLPELPIHYGDFAHWQRQWVRGDVLEEQLAYWKRQLGGSLPVLQLPTDRPRPPIQTFSGATHAFTLPAPLARALVDLSKQEDTTLFMTGLAAFQTLLRRYTEQEDIIVGVPLGDRPRAETEGLIGCLVNTVALRTDLGGNPTFRQLLRRVRKVALDAYDHRDLPFEQIVEALQPERNLSHQPIFQVMFVLQQMSLHGLSLPGVTLHATTKQDIGTARFDMLFALWEEDDGLAGSIEYNTDLFDGTTIARLAGHFATLLEGIVADPDRPIAEIPLLSPAEQQIILEWNDTQTAYPHDLCLHQLFEAQAVRSPEAIAAVFDDQHISYHALNEQANRLAYHLRKLGIGPGAFVAVYMERSLELLPALLGILKAGAAYVPLDPSYPTARIRTILTSLNIPCVITQTPLLQQAGDLHESVPALRDLICLDGAAQRDRQDVSIDAAAFGDRRLWTWDDLHRLPATNRPAPVDPDALAYVIFTSGSTGTPKGVMVQHRPVCNVIDWVNRTFGARPADRLLFVTSLCFDLSVYDIFGILATGGTNRIASGYDLRNPERLLGLLYDDGITFWDSAPAALQQLAPFFLEAEAAPPTTLRRVFLSGDWIPVRLPDQIRAAFPTAQVISLGGATEAAIWSNAYKIGEVLPQWTSIPYGTPIQNARYYILDAHLQPVPIGVPGDLYIGGDCLAAGYTNDPVLTADKFGPDPFNPTSSARMYRTGDRARFWADGTIEFLGRLDAQVKVRGYRIELGEIEAVLAQHRDVREAVVVVREDVPGDKRLVAYVAGQAGQPPAEAAVRNWVQTHLPEYMVPAAVVVLPSLPLTANGKLDRRALPTPNWSSPELEHGFVAPRTPAEEVLASIWGEVLGVERVGIYDQFFSLGGHSLLATQIIARVNDAFNADLPLRSVFEAPTVADLATLLAHSLAEQEDDETLAQMITEIEQLSEEDVSTILQVS